MKHRILILLSAILISLVGTAQDNVAGVILNEKGKPVKKIKNAGKGAHEDAFHFIKRNI